MQEHNHFGYTIRKVKRLGEGGFGYVDEIQLYNSDGKLCGNYARKTFYPSILMRQTILDMAQVKERFIEEVLCQARCVSNYVVPIYLHNLHVENPWFVMDLAISDLANIIQQNNLNIINKIDSLKMIVSGLDYVHKMNLLHRDIKPQNILLFKNELYKLSDFGLVKNLNRENPLTAIAAINMGTEGYKAPEIINAGLYDKRTDIYALGVVIEQFIGDPLHVIITKCTMRNPNDRYQSVSELFNDLDAKYQELINA